MSAFQVSDAHISVLVFARYTIRPITCSLLFDRLSDAQLGQLLIRENVASVEHRYPGERRKSPGCACERGSTCDVVHDPARCPCEQCTTAEAKAAEEFLAAFRPVRPARRLSVVEQIKAVHCYVYQSCEHEGWEASDGAHYCSALLDALVHALPGYGEAPWGFEATDLAAPAPFAVRGR
jgi:hypothetical protein